LAEGVLFQQLARKSPDFLSVCGDNLELAEGSFPNSVAEAGGFEVGGVVDGLGKPYTPFKGSGAQSKCPPIASP